MLSPGFLAVPGELFLERLELLHLLPVPAGLCLAVQAMFFSGLSLQFTCGPRLVVTLGCCFGRYVVFDRFLDTGFGVGPVLISRLRV